MAPPAVFLSYSRQNTEFVDRLRRDLHEAGVSVWRDRESLQPAEAWEKAIKLGIRESDVFAVVVSKQAISRSDSNQISECQFARDLSRPLRRLLSRMPLSRIKSRKLVQLKVDAVANSDIDLFFEKLGLGIFNKFNRIDFHSSYDDGFASLVGAAEIESMRSRRANRGGQRDSIINGWFVKDIPIYDTFLPPVAESELQTELGNIRELTPTLAMYFEREAEMQIARLKKDGRAVTINKGYGGLKLVIDKFQVEGKLDRIRRPRITFEMADYRHQIVFSNRIDARDSLSVDDRSMSIREYLRDYIGIDFDNFSWGDMERIPFPQRFANGVSVVVKGTGGDNRSGLVVGIRAEQSAVRNVTQRASTLACTVSCAEGMLRPDDARPDGTPSPILTAARALEEELGLLRGEDFQIEQVKLIAVGYDIERCQPVASHLLQLPDLSIDDIRKKWRLAKDRSEHNFLEFMPLTHESFDFFMSDKQLFRGKYLSLFSNHQRFVAATFASYWFGLDRESPNIQ